MSEMVNNLYSEMEKSLRLIARKQPYPSQLITLRVAYKNGLKVIDGENNQFSVKESNLQGLREIYTDKSYTTVSLHECEFSIKFFGMDCQKIDLKSNHVVFNSAKSDKKEIIGTPFKVRIVQSEAALKGLSQDLNGYVNRLGKRNLCEISSYAGDNRKSLIDLISIQPKELKRINHNPSSIPRSALGNSLSLLNSRDKKLLQILRHFITKEQISELASQQQISEGTGVELRKLGLGER